MLDYSLLLVLGGLGVGFLCASLFLRHRVGRAADNVRQEYEHRLSSLTEQSSAATGRIAELEGILNRVREGETRAQVEGARLAALLESERKTSAEKLKLLEDARRELGDAFKALSSEALRSNNQSFLDLAKTTLERYQEGARGELEKRQQAIHELVRPVRDSLAAFDQKIQEIEKARVGAYEGLSQQVRILAESQSLLRQEAQNLVKALGTPRVRGRWGEIQLKRVVELAGMLDYCDFKEQTSVNTEEGRLRPDLVVYLPGGKQIVVDAKAPLAAYLDAIEAPDEATRIAKLKDHARQISDHLSALGRKSYWEQFDPTPELVILFLPGESFLSAALDQDPTLIEVGVTERVMLATPITLITLLKAVAYGWRQERLAENARHISALGQELHKRVGDLAGHFVELGKRLGGAVESYNRAIGSLETRVLVTARRFEALGVVAGEKEIGVLEPLEQTPRVLPAPPP